MDLLTARARAESLMTSRCVIFHRGEPLTDPETGEVTATDGDPIYDGICRVRPVSSRGGGQVDAGGAVLYTFDYLVSVPFAVTGITEGDRVSVTSSLDPDLIGVDIEVRRVNRGETISARRLDCAEVT